MSAAGLWPNRLLCDYLDDAFAVAPDDIAIVGHRTATNDDTRVAVRELHALSVRFACGLAQLGVGRGDVVAVQLPNWWHYAALYVACVRIGAVINPLMPIFRERELEFMLGFAEARVLVVAQEYRGFNYPDMVATIRPALRNLDHVLVVGGSDQDTHAGPGESEGQGAENPGALDPRREKGSELGSCDDPHAKGHRAVQAMAKHPGEQVHGRPG